MSKTYKFHIEHHSEIGAGIHAYTEEVEIAVESGDPGGQAGEFEVFIGDALADWFDGANVTIVREEGT